VKFFSGFSTPFSNTKHYVIIFTGNHDFTVSPAFDSILPTDTMKTHGKNKGHGKIGICREPAVNPKAGSQ
jgi:hypothetical protein